MMLRDLTKEQIDEFRRECMRRYGEMSTRRQRQGVTFIRETDFQEAFSAGMVAVLKRITAINE